MYNKHNVICTTGMPFPEELYTKRALIIENMCAKEYNNCTRTRTMIIRLVMQV